MQRQDGILGVIGIVVVAAMIISLVSVLSGSGFSEPQNPLSQKAQPLAPEILSGEHGSQNTSEDETTPETEPESEPPTEPETEPPTEPETQPETEPPTEPETQPETEPIPPESTPQETLPPDSTQEPTQGADENAGETTPNPDGGGNSDSDIEQTGPAGDDGDGSGDGGNTPGSGEDDTVRIVTDLRSQQLTRLDLADGVFAFYAYPSSDDASYEIKAVLNNSATSMGGQVLTSSDAVHYEVPLVLNDTATITLYLKKNGENVSYIRYQIRYEAEKADEEHPEVGDYPPTILTNLDGYTDVMQTQDFVFWVSARTSPDGAPIYSNQIEVWLNGELVPKQTGDARAEYELHFEPPNVGDDALYTVKVRAWDGKGNSTMKVYTICYHTVSEGDYLGEVNVILDATTVGLGIIDSTTYPIVQGDTVAGVIIKFLEEYGYDSVYDGNATIGFYLRSISRGDLCSSASVPEKLWSMILRDGIQLSGNASRDSLGEYDYTMGAGWMYSINGTVYPGRGLSDYKLSSNTTIYLRFTLAYGKDIGGFDASGQGIGSLSSYCGVWIGGGYTPLSHSFVETDRVEATETTDGYVEHTCTKCGEISRETLPMTQPPTTLPEETEPEESKPEESKPEETTPEETEPEMPTQEEDT